MLLILLTAFACLMVTVTVALIVFEILEISADEEAYKKLTGWHSEFSRTIQQPAAQGETGDPLETRTHLLTEIPFPLRSYAEKVEKRVILEELLSRLKETEESKAPKNRRVENEKT